MKQLIHSCLLNMRWLKPTRRYARRCLFTTSYLTRTRGITVIYNMRHVDLFCCKELLNWRSGSRVNTDSEWDWEKSISSRRFAPRLGASDIRFPPCLEAQVGRIAGGSRHPLSFRAWKNRFWFEKTALTSFSLYTTSPIFKGLCLFFLVVQCTVESDSSEEDEVVILTAEKSSAGFQTR